MPNPIDEDVLLALIQLTRKNGFENRRVNFSLYEVVKLLGWDDGSKSYTRVIVSLLRWKAVLLTYHESWRDNSERRWLSRTFNMLDEVSIYTSPGRRSKADSNGQSQLPFSSFAWSEVVFKSFQDGYLKNLNFPVYKALGSRIAKRMYRFLDKCFGRLKGPSVSFDLRDFACGHIGLIGDYEPWKLKQVLAPAIRELEETGIIAPLSSDQRYEKTGRGKWSIVFQPPRPSRVVMGKTIPVTDSVTSLVAALEQHGVTGKTAAVLAAEFPTEQIELQLDVLEWWQSTNRKPVIKDPAAWLTKAVRDSYSPPKEYEPKVERLRKEQVAEEQRQKVEAAKRRRDEAERMAAAERATADGAKRAHVERFLASLSPAAREAFERQAIAEAPPLYRENIRRGNGPLAETSRQLVIEEAVLRASPMTS
nr:replication initiation protein [Fimbriiglobus ruber]